MKEFKSYLEKEKTSFNFINRNNPPLGADDLVEYYESINKEIEKYREFLLRIGNKFVSERKLSDSEIRNIQEVIQKEHESILNDI